jgi:ADP-ribose pyrophosphatase YjhB (NUDIX family)
VAVIGDASDAINPDPHLLLGKKDIDGVRWRLPGGFLNPDELPVAAACRELREETNVRLDPDHMRFLGHELIPDERYAGSEHSLLSNLFVAPIRITQASAGDDLKQVDWFRLKAVQELLDRQLIVPNHRVLIERALKFYESF